MLHCWYDVNTVPLMQSLSSFKRRQQGLNFLEEGKSLAKRSGELVSEVSGTSINISYGQPVHAQHLSSSLLSVNRMGADSMVCKLYYYYNISLP